MITRTGPISRAGVSKDGGSNDEQGIEPQEEVIGLRHRLNNRGVRPAASARTDRSTGAGCDG